MFPKSWDWIGFVHFFLFSNTLNVYGKCYTERITFIAHKHNWFSILNVSTKFDDLLNIYSIYCFKKIFFLWSIERVSNGSHVQLKLIGQTHSMTLRFDPKCWKANMWKSNNWNGNQWKIKIKKREMKEMKAMLN